MPSKCSLPATTQALATKDCIFGGTSCAEYQLIPMQIPGLDRPSRSLDLDLEVLDVFLPKHYRQLILEPETSSFLGV